MIVGMMDFEPTFASSKHHTTISKEYVFPSNQSVIPPPKKPFTKNFKPLITIIPENPILVDPYNLILLLCYPINQLRTSIIPHSSS